MSDTSREGIHALGRAEHNSDAKAKKVLIRSFNSDTGEWENQSINSGKLVYEQFDYISRVLTNSTTETYTYRLGGSSGTLVATVVVTYTDSTLETISTVEKT